jgi:hypothetical protein
MLRQNAYDCDWYRCRCVAICSIIEHPKHSCSVCSIAKTIEHSEYFRIYAWNASSSEDLVPLQFLLPASLKSKLAASLVKLRSQIRAELPEALDPNDDREEDDLQTTLEHSGGPFWNVALEEFEGVLIGI